MANVEGKFLLFLLVKKMQFEKIGLYDKNIGRMENSLKFYNNKINMITRINLRIKNPKSYV